MVHAWLDGQDNWYYGTVKEMRYKAIISYKGTNFSGWQIQKNSISIQEEIQKVLKEIFKQDVVVTASGRTDAGVHALGQVIHFDLDTTIQADKLPFVINQQLCADIKFLHCEEVSPGFHARFDAKAKTYIYKVYYSRNPIPLFDQTSLRLNKQPNVVDMKEAAKHFVGEHDFISFMASGSEVKTTVRTIYSLEITEDEEIKFTIRGNGFLYNMVRIIVGTLLDVGYAKIKPKDIIKIIDGKNRELASKTIDARGLCLHSVEY